MQYDFDRVIDRRTTDSIKWSVNEKMFGSHEVISAWVADMDFESPAPVVEALRARGARHLRLSDSPRGVLRRADQLDAQATRLGNQSGMADVQSGRCSWTGFGGSRVYPARRQDHHSAAGVSPILFRREKQWTPTRPQSAQIRGWQVPNGLGASGEAD